MNEDMNNRKKPILRVNKKKEDKFGASGQVKFVDRAKNIPLHRVHEIEKVKYERNDSSEFKEGSCTCVTF